MASERQRAANRRNGSKGGPSTEAGKQRSRLNTIKHGLTSTTLVVLPEEHQHEYEEVLRGFRESFQPYDATEEALVLRLAQAHWRSLRSRRVETGILNITAGTERALARKIVEDCPEHLNPHNAIAVGFMKNPEERWRAYLRYDGAISQDFFRTLDALMRLQRARQRTSPDPKPLVAAAGSGAPLSQQSEQQSNDTVELSDSGIRFVSQNSPNSSDHENQKELTQPESLDAGLLRSSKAAVPYATSGWLCEHTMKVSTSPPNRNFLSGSDTNRSSNRSSASHVRLSLAVNS